MNDLQRKVLIGLGLLVIVGGGTIYYSHATPKTPAQETQGLVAAVGRLMVLPSDEVPLIATVTDPTKLEDQIFFAGAQKGDQVLIYNKAHKAILYDPVADRIVNVAPLNMSPPPSPLPTP